MVFFLTTAPSKLAYLILTLQCVANIAVFQDFYKRPFVNELQLLCMLLSA